jgi:AcrR family transcriptional regulator
MKESKKLSRRSSESEEAILTATLELLKVRPLRDITIEAIAAKAGVGKMTIYKWWPSKAYVALDAFTRKMNRTIPNPDTGDAESDLAELLGSLMSFYSNPTGQILRQFIAESQSDPGFAASLRERFLNPRRALAAEVLERGLKRREIDPKLDRELILDLIFGPMIYRLILGHAPLNKKAADAMVSTLFQGIGKTPARTKRIPRFRPSSKDASAVARPATMRSQP